MSDDVMNEDPRTVLVALIEARGKIDPRNNAPVPGHDIDLKVFWAQANGDPIPGPVASGELIAVLEAVRQSIIDRIVSIPPGPRSMIELVPAIPSLDKH